MSLSPEYRIIPIIHVYKFPVTIKFLNYSSRVMWCTTTLKDQLNFFNALTCMAQEIRGVYLSNSFNVFFPNSTG